MNDTDLEERYRILFPTEKEKAAAFDEIARQFYFCNFGTMQKSDVETLLFSLYIDRILDMSEEDMQSYSDYTLSKYLGITQNKVSALKIRKELKYPYSGFDWKKSFARISEHARYENGKIKIYIPDKNLYFEIKNAIEAKGGYIDVQLNTTLLQVSPEYFLDLMLEVADDADKNTILEKLRKEFQEQKIDTDFIEAAKTKSFGATLKESVKDMAADMVIDIMESCIPEVSPVVGKMIINVVRVVRNGLKQNK